MGELMLICETCLYIFHLKCLDPPLDSIPGGEDDDWFCSKCLVKKEKEEAEEKEKERMLSEKSEKEMEKCWGCGKKFKNIGAHATRTTNDRCRTAYPEYQKSIEYELMPISMVAHVVGNIRIPPPELEPIEYNAASGSGAVFTSGSEMSDESSNDDYED